MRKGMRRRVTRARVRSATADRSSLTWCPDAIPLVELIVPRLRRDRRSDTAVCRLQGHTAEGGRLPYGPCGVTVDAVKRRHFLGNLLAAGASRGFAFQEADSSAPDPSVKRVLFMSKCHLDVGFVNTQANVIQKYFDVYFPRAIEIAAAMRK